MSSCTIRSRCIRDWLHAVRRSTVAVVAIALLIGCTRLGPAGGSAEPPPAGQTLEAGSPSRDQILAAARELIAGVRYATFSTIGDGGAPESRLMEPFAPEADFTIWMGTNAASSKVTEIEQRQGATLLYADPSRDGYVALTGRAVIVRDPSEKARRWNPSWTAFYKDANRGDDYVLIRFTPAKLEISSPQQGMNNDPATWKPVTIDRFSN